jgi:uncharacterized protein YndB with AHSA1/START domain
MTRITVSKTIAAPTDFVFRTVSDIENLPNTVGDVQSVEFLSERQSGVGTRFRETRMHKGKSMVTELEVTEYAENDHVRMVADSHGTVWDSLFTVRPAGELVELTITMDARPHKLLPKLITPLFKGMFRRGMEKHMDAVKAYCEGAA